MVKLLDPGIHHDPHAWVPNTSMGSSKTKTTYLGSLGGTLPENNIAPENRSFQKETKYSNQPFSGAMLVSGRVNVGKKSRSCKRREGTVVVPFLCSIEN